MSCGQSEEVRELTISMVEKYGDKYLVTKKLVLTLLVFSLATCIAVGVLLYYVGVAEGSKAVIDSEDKPDPEAPAELDSVHKTGSAKLTDVRLPRHLVPLKYKLELVPFIIPDNFTIRGFAEVRQSSP